jgi:alpha-beta hydrolase superfamily lysophospholipase
MNTSLNFTFQSEDGLEIFCYCWFPSHSSFSFSSEVLKFTNNVKNATILEKMADSSINSPTRASDVHGAGNSDTKEKHCASSPDEIPLKGIVQIAHGMAEHAPRYADFAHALNEAGYAVYANDHRGHGRTAESESQQGYLGGKDGFDRLIADMAHLAQIVRSNHPNIPLFLFGHSMGSFASQRFIMDYHDMIDGLILSGSNGKQGTVLSIGRLIAGIERIFRGDRAKSNLLNRLSFGAYNKKFAPNRTSYDWLSRDEESVDRYISDPWCGAIFPTSFFSGFFDILLYIENQEHFHKIPVSVPIIILSGDQDPVGSFGKGVTELYNRYRNAGVLDVNMKLYPGARHEILNEINREDVIRDIIDFLDVHTS